jgi:regulator of cell morphogenesis and NO signaling
MKLTSSSPTGDWAVLHPGAIPVFERYGVDYCCGGQRPLHEACRRSGVDAQLVLQELSDGLADQVESEPASGSLSELCDQIEQTHHAFLRDQLPLLASLLEKTVAAHGREHPELLDVRAAFEDLCEELNPHMLKEERVLFPAIRALEASPEQPRFPFGPLENPIGVMEHEHDHAGAALRSIRERTHGYTAPPGACPTWRALLAGLERLEADLHVHIHCENNILFPRAIALEESRRSRPPLRGDLVYGSRR